MNERNFEAERLLTFSETLAYLRISKSTLYRFMQSGQLQGYKVGSTWRFYLRDVQGVIKARNEVASLTQGRKGWQNKLQLMCISSNSTEISNRREDRKSPSRMNY